MKPRTLFLSAAVTDYLVHDGNLYDLKTSKGWTDRFAELQDENSATFYQMQGFWDSQHNFYAFTYDSSNRVAQVTEPAGRWLSTSTRRRRWSVARRKSLRACPATRGRSVRRRVRAARRGFWRSARRGGWRSSPGRHRRRYARRQGQGRSILQAFNFGRAQTGKGTDGEARQERGRRGAEQGEHFGGRVNRRLGAGALRDSQPATGLRSSSCGWRRSAGRRPRRSGDRSPA